MIIFIFQSFTFTFLSYINFLSQKVCPLFLRVIDGDHANLKRGQSEGVERSTKNIANQ